MNKLTDSINWRNLRDHANSLSRHPSSRESENILKVIKGLMDIIEKLDGRLATMEKEDDLK